MAGKKGTNGTRGAIIKSRSTEGPFSIEIIGTICLGKIEVCTPGLHAGIRCMAVASLVNIVCIMCQSTKRKRGQREEEVEMASRTLYFLFYSRTKY